MRKLYRENKRINRNLRREAYQKWFKRVFLGNMIRWTYWNDRPTLSKVISRFNATEPISLVTEVMNNNTTERLYFGLVRYRYQDFPYGKKMLFLKRTRDYQLCSSKNHTLYLNSNLSVAYHRNTVIRP